MTSLRSFVYRWRFPLFAIGLVALNLAVLAALGIIPVHELFADHRLAASARLFAPQNPSGVFAQHPDPPIDRQTHITLIKSQLVLSAALRPDPAAGKPDVANLPVVKAQADPIDWLSQNLVVDFDGPEVIRISLTLDDPEQARLIVDAVTNAYLTEIIGEHKKQRLDRIDRLTEMATNADESLRRARAAVKRLAETALMPGTDPKVAAYRQQIAQERLGAAQRELADMQRQVRRLRVEDVVLSGRIAGQPEVPATALAVMVDEDPEVRASGRELARVEERIESLRKTAREPEKAPEYAGLTEKLAGLKAEHARLRDRTQSRVLGDFRLKMVTGAATRLVAVREELRLTEELIKGLSAEVDQLEKQVLAGGNVGVNLEQYRAELSQAEDLARRIKSALTTAKLEADAPPRVRELEKATIQGRK